MTHSHQLTLIREHERTLIRASHSLINSRESVNQNHNLLPSTHVYVVLSHSCLWCGRDQPRGAHDHRGCPSTIDLSAIPALLVTVMQELDLDLDQDPSNDDIPDIHYPDDTPANPDDIHYPDVNSLAAGPELSPYQTVQQSVDHITNDLDDNQQITITELQNMTTNLTIQNRTSVDACRSFILDIPSTDQEQVTSAIPSALPPSHILVTAVSPQEEGSQEV